MKPAARACWRHSPAITVLTVLAIVLALGLGGIHAWRQTVLAPGEEAQAAGTLQHVVQAQVLTQVGQAPQDGPARFAPALEPLQAGDGWRTVPLPYRWSRAVIPGHEVAAAPWQVTWLRLDLQEGDAGEGAYLYLPRWQTVGRIAVYADDRLIYQSAGDTVWNAFNHPLWLPLTRAKHGGAPTTLLLRIDSLAEAGGAVSTAWIGAPEPLAPRVQWRRLLQTGVSETMGVAVMGLGLFAFAVWLLRRHESAYLLFAVYALLVALRGWHFHVGLQPLPLPSAWFGWMTVNAVNALLVTWYFFVATLVPNPPRWIGRALLLLLAASCTVTLPALAMVPTFDALAPLSYLLTIFAGVPAVLAMAWVAWRRGAREGIIASAVGVIDAPVAIHDWLMQNYLISPEEVYLWPVSTTARLLMFVYIILRRYVGAVEEVEQANATLAQRLAAREAELAASYEQLREVQQRQTLTRERQRLMQDIHDGMGSQLMSALKVAEAGRLSETDMALLLRECIDDLKLTVDSLEPVDADLLILLATLRYRLLSRLQGSNLQLRWDVVDVPRLEWLDPRSALHVLRILQEAIANVLQHAQASELRVATGEEAGGVFVTLHDNGQGFTPPAAEALGHGVSNMVRRARAIGGEVSWEAAAHGTRMKLWLPLRQGLRGEPAPLAIA